MPSQHGYILQLIPIMMSWRRGARVLLLGIATTATTILSSYYSSAFSVALFILLLLLLMMIGSVMMEDPIFFKHLSSGRDDG